MLIIRRRGVPDLLFKYLMGLGGNIDVLIGLMK
jgi:hypothetical protein